MKLTEAEAAELVKLIEARLTACGAVAVLAGIEETRRQGIEETFQQNSRGFSLQSSRADIREVGTIRRRPPTNNEMLSFVFDRLYQRLIVLPAIVQRLHESLGNRMVWRVDSEFVSPARKEELEANADDLLPEDLTSIRDIYRTLEELLPELVSARTRDV